MSKRAYRSAFGASPPYGTQATSNSLDAPQPQVQQHVDSSPTTLRIPGQWPEEESSFSIDELPLPSAVSVFTTIGWWVATVAIVNFITLPQRVARRFLRRQTIAAVPVIRDDGSNKKRLVDLGCADEPTTLSPSARARTNMARRRAPPPATTFCSGFSYPSPESSSSDLSYDNSPKDIHTPRTVLEKGDDDNSLSFSFSDSDVWTSPPLRKSPISSPAQKSEDLPSSPPSPSQVSPLNKLRHPFPNEPSSPTPRMSLVARPPGMRPIVLGPQFKLSTPSWPVSKFQINPNIKIPRLPHEQRDLPPHWSPFPWNGARPQPDLQSSVTTQAPFVPNFFSPKPSSPARVPKHVPSFDPRRTFRMPARKPPQTRTQLGRPLVIDPSRPLRPLTAGPPEKPRYWVAPLEKARRELHAKAEAKAKFEAACAEKRLFVQPIKAASSRLITPMRRQLLKLQYEARIPQEQHSSDPGTSLADPTNECATSTSSLSTDVPSSSLETSVQPSSLDTHVPEEPFVYENDLSFLPDAPAPTPPIRKTVKWHKNLEEMRFFCDENVNKMMQSLPQKIIANNSPKAVDGIDRELKESKQPKEVAEEHKEHSDHQIQEYEDDSTDPESEVSAVDGDKSDSVHTNEIDDEDASHDSLFDEGSNISQLDDINAQSLEELEISSELLEELSLSPQQHSPAPPLAVKPLVSPLSQREDDELEAAAKKAKEAITNGVKEVHLTKTKKVNFHDFGTLLPKMFNGDAKAWLNDSIIDEYLSIIVEHKKKEAGFVHQSKGFAPPVHAFSSYWYKTTPASIKRWAEKVNLGGAQYLEAELILYPICVENHWRLLAVKPKERVIEYFDSLGFSSAKHINKFKEYIQQELGPEWIEDEWTVVKSQNSERQLNGSDCGVFTLLNALVLLRGEEPKRVVADHGMEDARKRIATTLLAGQPTTEWA